VADPDSILESLPDRRRFLRDAGLTFVGVSLPLPVLADTGPEQREAWRRVPADVAWRDFEQNLEAVLSDLGTDEYLVLTVRRCGGRYLQFAGEGRFGMLAETSSNRFLDPSDQLGAAAQQRVIALGTRASADAGEADATGSDEHDPMVPGRATGGVVLPIDGGRDARPIRPH